MTAPIKNYPPNAGQPPRKGGAVRAVGCPRCDRKFKDEHGLKQHLADYHRESKRPGAPERYPLDIDYSREYEPRQIWAGLCEDDY